MNQHTYKVGSPHRINRFLEPSSATSPSYIIDSISPSPHSNRSNSQNHRNSSQKRNKSWGRFIPTKVSNDLYQMFIQEFDEKNNNKLCKSPRNNEIRDVQSSSSTLRDRYKSQLYSQLLISNISPEQSSPRLLNQNKPPKLFKFNEQTEKLDDISRINSQCSLINSNINHGSSSNSLQNIEIQRKINKVPFKKLDAPGLREDFYLNLLDWSCLNILAIGLDKKLYTWSAYNNKTMLMDELEYEQDYIGAIAWSQNGHNLALGNNLGEIKLYDTAKSKLIKTIPAHSFRIGSLAWNGNLLASGSRDKKVMVRDIRITPNRNGDMVKVMSSHKQEICGLKWSFDENLLASGGNDNKVVIWSLRNQAELVKFGAHTAAVKALAWSPHQYNLLATGGGTSDRTIRFWNTHNLREIDCIDSGSQVCNLMFSKNVNELVSTHGYSLNQINIWKYPSMEKIASLTGHSMRVLYLANSPCGENIVTGAGDETLMFWNVFPSNQKNYTKGWEEFGGKVDLR